jgi:phenylacetate-CoA ligase
VSFYNTLTRHVLAPSFDLIRGTHTMKRLAELEQTQWWPRERIEELQAERLQHLIRHAYDHVLYYRRLMDERGLKPEDIKSAQDLTRIPPLTKQLIRDNFDSLVAEGFPREDLRPGSSGGTTGERLHFYSTRHERLTLAYARWARSLEWTGVKPGDAHMSVRQHGSQRRGPGERLLRRISVHLQRAQMVDTMTVREENLPHIFSLIQRTRPRSIHSYPSALALLASYVRAEGKTCPHVPSICLAGEQTLDRQRSVVREVFGSNPYVRYGSDELHEVAGQCDVRAGLHIFAEDFIIEVVGTNGALASTSDRGRLLITSLHNHGMPFIRYESGDIGSLLPGACPCGRGLPLMSPQIGRTLEYIYTKSGVHIAAMDINVADILPSGTVQYQLSQENIDSFVLLVVPPGPLSADTWDLVRGRLTEFLRARLAENVSVELRLVDRIEMNLSGKRLAFISRIDTAAVQAQSDLP